MTSLKLIKDFAQIMYDIIHSWGYNSVIKSFTVTVSGCNTCSNATRKQKAMLSSQTESFVLCYKMITQCVRLVRYSSPLCNCMPLYLGSCNYRSAQNTKYKRVRSGSYS